ncbi:MAG: glycosyltransferase family A protein [Ignavibacteria bacterium]|nr:glycosyltransferase family A protein [Ignavibacteria bacterium]
MPTYNCAEYISDAINSILMQTYKDFEFLIIDDGSTDDTAKILHQLTDSRIRVISVDHCGKSAALNLGLNEASHNLILHMDADDIAHPKLLENQIFLYGKKSRQTWVGCNYAVFDEKTKKITFLVRNRIKHEEIVAAMSLHGAIAHGGSIVDRQFLIKAGGYKELDAFGDYEFWLRGIRDFYFENNQEILLYVRSRSNSLSRSNINYKYKLHYEIQRPYYSNMEYYFKINNITNQISIRGWREFFYGDKNKARMYWLQDKRCFFRDYRIALAFLLTKLPETMLTLWKENRVRYRMKYWIKILTKENRIIRADFNKLVQK